MSGVVGSKFTLVTGVAQSWRSCSLYAASRVGSGTPVLLKLSNRPVKKKHLARPNVCAPDRVTRSVELIPKAANLDFSTSRVSNGLGRFAAAALFAILLSFLPNGTIHAGPPDYCSN